MHVPRNDYAPWTAPSATLLAPTSKPPWPPGMARSLSRDAFRTQFFDLYTNDEVVDHLRSAARGIVEGQTHDDLTKAGDDLAAAAQKVGVHKWPRFLGNASHQAVDAVSKGIIPRVVKVGATDEPVGVAGLMFLGLLAIIFGTSRPSVPAPSKTYPMPSFLRCRPSWKPFRFHRLKKAKRPLTCLSQTAKMSESPERILASAFYSAAKRKHANCLTG